MVRRLFLIALVGCGRLDFDVVRLGVDASGNGDAMPGICGDGLIGAGEACDDKNEIDGDGCSADCKSDESCGNGIIDRARGETCDDSNLVSSDGCSATCQSNESCGNAFVDPGEQCDNGGIATASCDVDCTLPLCGDGTLNPAVEQCDAGAGNSNVPDASCRTNCLPRRCGDGVIDIQHGELCDDGNVIAGDGCNSNCTGP
jgi:cysteine-rich repeat protein